MSTAAEAISTYTPLPKMQAFHASDAKYRLVMGGAGSGKSTAAIWEDIMLALEFPGSTGVVYRKTYPALRDTTKRDYLSECPPELIADEIKSEGREELVYVNGSRTLFRCLDDFRKLGSASFDRIFVEEAWEVPTELFRMLLTRMRGKIGPRRMVLATQPPNRDTWLYDFFVRNAAPDRQVFHFTSYDNPHLPADQLAELEKMPEQWRRKYLLGEWGALSKGAPVFPGFRTDLHVGELAYAPGLPVLRGWDFGFRHPVCVWLQVAPTSHVAVLHELMGQDQALRFFATQVQDLTARWFPGAMIEDYCDVAGTQRNDRGPSAVQILQREFQLRPRFRKIGLWQSIERITKLLTHIPDGRPLLRFDRRGCPLLIDAMAGGYAMTAPKADDGVKDEPKKDGYYDNLVDALRYALAPVVALDGGSPYAGKPFPARWRMTNQLEGAA